MAVDTNHIAMAAEVDETVDIAVLYKSLEEVAKVTPFREIDLLIRLRHGIKPKHSQNVLELYFYYLYKHDRDTYRTLVQAKDEQDMKLKLGNKVMKNFLGGVKSVCIYSDLFTEDFLKIINAYLDHVERR